MLLFLGILDTGYSVCIILNFGSKRLSPGDKQAVWMDWVLPIVCTTLGRKRTGWEKVYLNNEHRNQLEIVCGTPWQEGRRQFYLLRK